MPVRTPLRPGWQTPMRPVPARIPRPEYVGKTASVPSIDPWVQPPEGSRRCGWRAGSAQALAEGGQRTTQFEHALVVTADGAEILTLP